MIEFIVKNWYMILALVCIVIMAIFAVLNFLNLPNDKKIENVKKWLEWAVVEAEKMFGGNGMGSIKLRYVYDLCVSKFPWVGEIISFSQFSLWVDEALEWMENQLKSNKTLSNYVKDDND